MTKERLALGEYGEKLAFKKIKGLGYKNIVRNYCCPLGEVDLIAEDGDTLAFIEIKTRRGRSMAYAKEAVDARKRRQISKVALAYMKANNRCDVKARFDVVAVRLTQGKPEIEVIKNAFDLAY
ncbi:MAG: YraN family protein [Desulfatiglandaceae bacterium]